MNHTQLCQMPVSRPPPSLRLNVDTAGAVPSTTISPLFTFWCFTQQPIHAYKLSHTALTLLSLYR